jgi:tetratricopeptide (TPR) repeat protein
MLTHRKFSLLTMLLLSLYSLFFVIPECCRGTRRCAPKSRRSTSIYRANGTEVDKLFQEGVGQFRRGEYPKALVTYQRVLEIRRQLNDKAGIGQTLNNMGEVYLGLGQPEKALEVLLQDFNYFVP